MKFIIDKGTGYTYCYNPTHYCANKAGKVLEHVYVMAEAIKRRLEPNECVHHKDRDRTNNDINNLQLLSMSEHAKLHQMEDNGVEYITYNCKCCNVPMITTKNTGRIYCSASCANKAQEKFSISKEDLDYLVWAYPTTKVAKILGVSDVAVGKRCKKLGISKPPRGYWAKVAADKL
jgi:hypothetical protein